MKAKILAIILICGFLTIFAAALSKYAKKQDRVCFGSRCFAVKIAATPQERGLGLMFREKLESFEGMLFIFEKDGSYSFWMKNTLIPLDMIWLNGDREIVFIKENAAPCPGDPCPSIFPGKEARYVLEINAGISQKIGLKEGDRAVFKNSK